LLLTRICSDKPWEILSKKDNPRRDDAGTSTGGSIDLTLDFVLRPVFRVSFFSGLLAQKSPEIQLKGLPIFLLIAERLEKRCLMTTNEMRWGREMITELFLRYDGSFYVLKDHVLCRKAPRENVFCG